MAFEGLRRKRDQFVTNLEDQRALKSLKKREAARLAKLNAASAPIEQTAPRDVELPQARSSVSQPVLAGENPSVTGRGGINQAQAGQTVTVQPDKPPLRTPVEITRGGTGPDAGTTSTVHSDGRGGTISDADLKAQNLQRAKAAAIKGAQEVLAKPAAFSAAQVKAAGELISSGAAAESIGEVVGRNVEGANRGLNKGLSDVAAIEAETPLRPAPAVADDVVLKGPAEQPTLRSAEPAAGPAQPKPQRTVLGRGLDAAAKIPDRLVNKPIPPTGPPEPPKQRFGRTKAVAGTGLRVGGALAIPEIAAKVAGSVQRGTFLEDAERLITDAPEMVGDLIRYVTENPERAGKEAVNWIANLPNDVVAGLGSFNETVSGRNFDVPASGITGAPATNTFEMADQKPFGDLSVFDLEEDGAPPQEGQELIDESFAPREQSTGLRTASNNIVPQSNDSFFINNQGGEAPGEKQFFRDLPQAFPQAQQGLRGAREELSNRNRFSDDPLANLAGEFAQSRVSSDRAAFDQTERKNASSLASAIGTSQNTANTAALKADADRFNKIDEGLNSEDDRTRRNTQSSVFNEMINQVNQGVVNPNNADIRQASNIITRAVVDQGDVGLPKAIWNSLAPALLGGGGRGALDLLNGDPSINGGIPFADIAFDDGGNLVARSTDPDADIVNLGYIKDPDTANFLRQILDVHKQKGQ